MTKYRTIDDLKRHEWWWGYDKHTDKNPAKDRYNPKRYADVFLPQFHPMLNATTEKKKEKDEKWIREVFKVEFVESAWIYEGYRRAYTAAWPRYCDLPLETMTRLAELFPVKGAWCLPTRNHASGDVPGKGWTEYFKGSFNLELPNSALMREFKRFIKAERDRLKIQSKPNNVDRRRRKREFTVWETWDRKKWLTDDVSESADKVLKKAEEEIRSEKGIPAELLLVE
jgi:hypothetical protein